jgi:hypothetical protein
MYSSHRSLQSKHLSLSLCPCPPHNKKAPSQEEQSELWNYAEVIDLKVFVQWRDQMDIRNGVHRDHGRVIFNEFNTPPHEMMCGKFFEHFYSQMMERWGPVRPNPSLPHANAVLPMPIQGQKWPTIAFEFSNENESLPENEEG